MNTQKTDMSIRKKRIGFSRVLALFLTAVCMAGAAGCGFYKPDDSVKLEPVAEDPEPLPEFAAREAADTDEASGESIQTSVRTASGPEGTGKDTDTLIVCMGDSITYGTGTAYPSTQSYPALLKKKLGDGYRVRNLGRPGYTLTESTWCYTADPAYEEALSSRADIYIFMLGTNDAYPHFWNAESYRTDLRQVIGELREAAPDAEIWLMTPPHCFLPEGSGSVSDAIISGEIAGIVREIAEEEETGLIDLCSYTEERGDLFTDDLVHPNQDGYREFADYIYRMIFPVDR